MRSSTGRVRRPARHRRAVIAVAALAGLGVLAGCGSDSGGSQTNAAVAAPRITLTASLSITSPVAIEADFTDVISGAAAAPTCAEAALGYDRDGLRYDPPRTDLSQPVDGHVVAVNLHVQGYHGPGSYPLGALAGEGGSSVLMSIDDAGYGATKGATGTVVVHPDDSGVVTLDHLGIQAASTPVFIVPTGTLAPPVSSSLPFSGIITWKCNTERPPAATPTPAPTPTPFPTQTQIPTPTPVATPTPVRRTPPPTYRPPPPPTPVPTPQ